MPPFLNVLLLMKSLPISNTHFTLLCCFWLNASPYPYSPRWRWRLAGYGGRLTTFAGDQRYASLVGASATTLALLSLRQTEMLFNQDAFRRVTAQTGMIFGYIAIMRRTYYAWLWQAGYPTGLPGCATLVESMPRGWFRAKDHRWALGTLAWDLSAIDDQTEGYSDSVKTFLRILGRKNVFPLGK
ncbi:hypothetical protein GOBAR_DD02663 [Gossypium barbadense]|nr:hypothetical protein GOBAR_DD02663 [Gossypium barbadense]